MPPVNEKYTNLGESLDALASSKFIKLLSNRTNAAMYYPFGSNQELIRDKAECLQDVVNLFTTNDAKILPLPNLKTGQAITALKCLVTSCEVKQVVREVRMYAPRDQVTAILYYMGEILNQLAPPELPQR